MFPDSPHVTAQGLLHLGNYPEAEYIRLERLPAHSVTDDVLEKIRYSKLWRLHLGDPSRESSSPPKPSVMNVSAAALVWFVRLHTRIRANIALTRHLDVGTPTHSRSSVIMVTYIQAYRCS